MAKRRKATFSERTTPCQCCKHPLSHRHHMWEVAAFGENTSTVSLCASCHDLYHIIFKALVEDSPRYMKLLDHYIDSTSQDDPKFKFLYLMILEDQDEKKRISSNSARLVKAVEDRMRAELGENIKTAWPLDRRPVGAPVEMIATVRIKVTGTDRDGKGARSTWRLAWNGTAVTKARRIPRERVSWTRTTSSIPYTCRTSSATSSPSCR